LLGEAGAELALQAQNQLDARQAVHSKVALERAVEGDLGGEMRMRLACNLRDDGEQLVRIDGRSHAGGECTLRPHAAIPRTGVMTMGWFDTSEVDAFAKWVVGEVVQRMPPDSLGTA